MVLCKTEHHRHITHEQNLQRKDEIQKSPGRRFFMFVNRNEEYCVSSSHNLVGSRCRAAPIHVQRLFLGIMPLDGDEVSIHCMAIRSAIIVVGEE